MPVHLTSINKGIRVYVLRAIELAKKHKQETGTEIHATKLKELMLEFEQSVIRNHYFFNTFIYLVMNDYQSGVTINQETGFINAKEN